LIIFFFLGHVYSKHLPYSNEILIYKIGDYANFTEVNSFINKNTVEPTSPTYNNPPTSPKSTNKNSVIIGATLGSISGIIIILILGLIIFKWYKRTHSIIKTA
jgi:hypothetical protein